MPEFFPHFSSIRLDECNLVSDVLPQNGELTPEQVERAPEVEWAGGEVKISSQNDTLLISRTIPRWYRSKMEGSFQKVQAVFNEFLNGEIEIWDENMVKGGNAAVLTGEYDRNVISSVFLDEMINGLFPNEQYERNRRIIEDDLKESTVKVLLYAIPTLHFYKAEREAHLGQIALPSFEPRFRATRGWAHFPTPEWYSTPALIEPWTEIRPEDASRPISLVPHHKVWTLDELVKALSVQGLMFVTPTPDISGSSFFIAQRTNWTAATLLRAVGAVGGYQLKVTPKGYVFETSPAHREVADVFCHFIRGRQNQQETLKTIPLIFSARGNELQLPLELKHFGYRAPQHLESFDSNTRNQLLAHLDQEIRDKAALIWPIFRVAFAISLEPGSTSRMSLGRATGFEAAPFEPQTILTRPADWKGIDIDEVWRQHGAKIWM